MHRQKPLHYYFNIQPVKVRTYTIHINELVCCPLSKFCGDAYFYSEMEAIIANYVVPSHNSFSWKCHYGRVQHNQL